MKLKVIYGKAGCGKTTKMVDMICKAKDYVVLAPTNAAVENIYNMCSERMIGIDRDNFKTLYSFFRIDYENNNVLGAILMP